MTGKSSSYTITLILTLWLVSLTTQGFVRILHLLVQGALRMPYLWLTLNVLTALYTLYYGSKLIHAGYRKAQRGTSAAALGLITGLFYPLLAATATMAGLAWAILVLSAKYAPRAPRRRAFTIRYYRLGSTGSTSGAGAIIALAITLLVIIGVILVMYAPVQASYQITGVQIQHPYNVYGVYRLIPLYTAYAYASDRIQLPTHTVYKSETYIYYTNDTPIYNWMIEPEGFWNALTKRPIGALFVEGDKYPVKVQLVKHNVVWGLRNMRFKILYFDSLQRRVKLSALGYDIRFDEAVELYRNSQLWIAIPYNTWERGLLWTLRKPAGIILVSSNGSIRKLSLTSAAGTSVLKGVPLVSEKTAREWAEKYAYRNGFVAVYFKHNRYVIRDVGENPQPYLEPGDNGTLWWVFTVEPAGNTYSTKYILYINARDTSGKPRIYLWRPSQLLIGVSKVMSYVKQAHPNYDWGQVKAVEPLPTVHNDTVLWKVSVVTGDYRGLISIDVIDARTGQDTSFKVERPVTASIILKSILQGGGVYNETQPGSITDKISRIQWEINQTIQRLNDLYRQLELLKEELNSTR